MLFLMYILSIAMTLAAMAASTLANTAAPNPEELRLADNFERAISRGDVANARSIVDDIKTQGLMDAVAFKLAFAVKNAKQRRKRAAGDEDDRIMKLLPISVRNLVFPRIEPLCIRWVHSNYYFITPEQLDSVDNRYVLAANADNLENHGNKSFTFSPTRTETDWRIINAFGESLYAHKSFYSGGYENFRKVFYATRANKERIFSDVWRIQLYGDDVTMQNVWYGVKGGGGNNVDKNRELLDYGPLYNKTEDVWNVATFSKEIPYNHNLHLYRIDECP